MSLRTLLPLTRPKSLLSRHDEEYPLYALQREMNNLFDGFFRGWELPAPVFGDEVSGDYIPNVNMHETEKEIVVSAEVPGMEEKDLSISLSRDTLTISGEKKTEKEEKAKGYYRMERKFGSFKRSISLPGEVNADATEAQFKNGVLTVTMPKTAESQKNSKSIPIKKS